MRGQRSGRGACLSFASLVSATMKRCRGSGEEGVEDLISDSGNDHDDGEASFSESHCLFTCSIDGA
jgi:hypothetical protein